MLLSISSAALIDSSAAGGGDAVAVAAKAGLLCWYRIKNNAAAAATVTHVVLRIGARVLESWGLGFWGKAEEDEALIEDDLNGGGVLKERDEMGLGNDGRW